MNKNRRPSLGDILQEAFEHSVDDVLERVGSEISVSDRKFYLTHVKQGLEKQKHLNFAPWLQQISSKQPKLSVAASPFTSF